MAGCVVVIVTADNLTDAQIEAFVADADPRVAKVARCALGLSRGKIADAINASAKAVP